MSSRNIFWVSFGVNIVVKVTLLKTIFLDNFRGSACSRDCSYLDFITFSFLFWGKQLWRPFPTSQAEGGGFARPRQLPETYKNALRCTYYWSRIGRGIRKQKLLYREQHVRGGGGDAESNGKTTGPGVAKLKERPRDQQWRFEFRHIRLSYPSVGITESVGQSG